MILFLSVPISNSAASSAVLVRQQLHSYMMLDDSLSLMSPSYRESDGELKYSYSKHVNPFVYILNLAEHQSPKGSVSSWCYNVQKYSRMLWHPLFCCCFDKVLPSQLSDRHGWLVGVFCLHLRTYRNPLCKVDKAPTLDSARQQSFGTFKALLKARTDRQRSP